MTSVRAFALGLLVSAGLACDPCDTARDLHTQRCAAGFEESCWWLQEHVALSGACVDFP